MASSVSGGPQPHHRLSFLPSSRSVGTAAALRLGHLLRHRINCYHRHPHLQLQLGLALCDTFKKFFHRGHVPRPKDLWHESNLLFQFKGSNPFQLSNIVMSTCCTSCFSFFNGDETANESGDAGPSSSNANPFNGRQWTNILLAVNVGVYITGLATQWRLFLWGAKINQHIAKGQVWRLVTCAFLHSNIVHLLVNCYSLNSVGPAMEENIGPGRFLAVYFASAIAGSAMSYRFCNLPTVGASGALFGLVGSLAVFVSRHRDMFGGGKEYLQRIAYVITFNMVIGHLHKRIDNWGHLGGLLGGVAVSWIVGPVWKYESMSGDGRKIFVDKAPLNSLADPKQTRRWFLNSSPDK